MKNTALFICLIIGTHTSQIQTGYTHSLCKKFTYQAKHIIGFFGLKYNQSRRMARRGFTFSKNVFNQTPLAWLPWSSASSIVSSSLVGYYTQKHVENYSALDAIKPLKYHKTLRNLTDVPQEISNLKTTQSRSLVINLICSLVSWIPGIGKYFTLCPKTLERHHVILAGNDRQKKIEYLYRLAGSGTVLFLLNKNYTIEQHFEVAKKYRKAIIAAVDHNPVDGCYDQSNYIKLLQHLELYGRQFPQITGLFVANNYETWNKESKNIVKALQCTSIDVGQPQQKK